MNRNNLRFALAGLAISLATASAQAGTFVYVSNAEDGTIGAYSMAADGTLTPGARVEAGKSVMPMTLTKDSRNLIAAVRSKPFTAVTYAIDQKTGAIKQTSSAPLADSFPYIFVDKTGRWLMSASFGGHRVAVNPISANGKVGPDAQVIPTALNAHSIVADRTNRFVFVPHLGSDQIFQFRFNPETGKLSSNTPATLQMKQGTGPRHIIFSRDNKFAYMLSEMSGMVTTLSLDQKTGLLTQVSEASILPADTKMRPGVVRGGGGQRDVSNDIWASDLHLTPDGKFLYAAERTSGTLGGFSVDQATGKLTYIGSTTVEKQPRGFRIHPNGKFMVVTGEQSETISVFAIEASGSLKLVQKYPTGKGSNWVEIVDFK